MRIIEAESCFHDCNTNYNLQKMIVCGKYIIEERREERIPFGFLVLLILYYSPGCDYRSR
jgi:hypothetical protein